MIIHGWIRPVTSSTTIAVGHSIWIDWNSVITRRRSRAIGEHAADQRQQPHRRVHRERVEPDQERRRAEREQQPRLGDLLRPGADAREQAREPERAEAPRREQAERLANVAITNGPCADRHRLSMPRSNRTRPVSSGERPDPDARVDDAAAVAAGSAITGLRSSSTISGTSSASRETRSRTSRSASMSAARMAAVALEQRKPADFVQQLVGVAIGQRRDPEAHVAEHLDVDAAEAEARPAARTADRRRRRSSSRRRRSSSAGSARRRLRRARRPRRRAP